MNVDAVNRLALAVVAERPPVLAEARWEWLSTCWENLFHLSRQATLSFDEVDGLLAQEPAGQSVSEQDVERSMSQLANIVVRLHTHRDIPEQREQARRDLEAEVSELRVRLLDLGSAIGWHPRLIGRLWGGASRRHAVVPMALQLRGRLLVQTIFHCYRDALRGPLSKEDVDHPQRVMDYLDELDEVLTPWRAVFDNIEVPSTAVSSHLSMKREASRPEMQRLLQRVNRDIDCLVQGAQAWQVEKEMSLVPMAFAFARLSTDLREMREMVSSSSAVASC